MAEPSSPPTESVAPQTLFRAGKKRKNYRARADNDEETPKPLPQQPIPATAGPATPSSANTTEDQPDHSYEGPDADSGIDIAEVIRRRNARKQRLAGIGFRREQDAKADEGMKPEPALASLSDNEDLDGFESSVATIAGRFAPQTGLVGQMVNKHMEEYIELELAKRMRSAAKEAAAGRKTSGLATPLPGFEGVVGPAGNLIKKAESQPTQRGKLVEIDLGSESRARNIVMTEHARRRLEGESVDEEDEGSRAKKGPGRSRECRDSEDTKRDQLIDEFLRENRLDVYDMQQGNNTAEAPEDDLDAADDRIAEEFRREFLEALSQRQRRRRLPAVNATPRPRRVERPGVLKGPKLGGSRNDRAAMRDLLLKEQQGRRRH